MESIFTVAKNNLDKFDLLGLIMGGWFKVILNFEGFPYNAVVIFGLEPDFFNEINSSSLSKPSLFFCINHIWSQD